MKIPYGGLSKKAKVIIAIMRGGKKQTLNTTALSKEIGVGRVTVLKALRELESSGRVTVKKKGAGPSTRWIVKKKQ